MDKLLGKIIDSEALIRLVLRELQQEELDSIQKDDCAMALLIVLEKLSEAVEEINNFL